MAKRQQIAPYACHSDKSLGRLIQEAEDSQRSVFQRDRDRIIHCVAFRRLEYKTQVFVNHEGDHFRTRLTHSLEVAQIARSIARAMCLDEDLTETLALAHDLGHPPFGHAGEDALDEQMKKYGGFDHNDQAFRILTELETKYMDFNGLNMTWETLEGVVKHNGPLKGKYAKKSKAVPETIAIYDKNKWELKLDTFASAEAQVAALSDDIAYNNHDVDDGLRAGLFTIDQLKDLPLFGPKLKKLMKEYPDAHIQRLTHEVVRRVISAIISDLIKESEQRIRDLKIQTNDDIRYARTPVIVFSDKMQKAISQIRQFLHEHMYRHYRVNIMRGKAKKILDDLFKEFLNHPEYLPNGWRQLVLNEPKKAKRAKIICDYVAGMTDRYAIEQHQKLFNIYETT